MEIENHEEKIEQPVTDTEAELSEEELDEASGGIIIVSGKLKASGLITPNIRFAELNPQPLPPGPPPDKNLGGLGGH